MERKIRSFEEIEKKISRFDQKNSLDTSCRISRDKSFEKFIEGILWPKYGFNEQYRWVVTIVGENLIFGEKRKGREEFWDR